PEDESEEPERSDEHRQRERADERDRFGTGALWSALLDLRLALLTRTVRTMSPLTAVAAMGTPTSVATVSPLTTMGAAAVGAGWREPGRELPLRAPAIPKVSVMPSGVPMMAR